MKTFRHAITAILATATLLASAAAALAAPGQITANVNVRTGPGTSYAVVDMLRIGTSVEVTQCRDNWCYVSANRTAGWVSADYIGQPRPQRPTPTQPTTPGFNFGIQIGPDGEPSFNFGVNPPSQPEPQRPQRPRPPRPQPLPLPEPPPVDDIAQACFYSGQNFSGNSFCVEEGESVRALRPNWNDRIRSVEPVQWRHRRHLHRPRPVWYLPDP
ncbi:SH3 domain-containing protein [Devosia algicola]|uniref:SH3 domain-containing protein n=1 Tax=Devosia algicola TaxID=3026418 RepID=A0ABY7YRZ8_9HYPH|nr:SH3 domain-containing protein [Devosia algicola]WDR04021.1 SH3 domain-containing protein [Devosia algicola]